MQFHESINIFILFMNPLVSFSSIGELISLEKLDISKNSFSTEIPDFFSRLGSLKELDAKQCCIATLPKR